MQARLRALCVLPLAALLAACGASARTIQEPPSQAGAAHCRSGSIRAVGSHRVAVAAVVRGIEIGCDQRRALNRPNGVTGYVRAGSVRVGPVRTRLVVDVSARRLTLYRSGRPVLSTAVAVGSQATPTPVGSYYVNQLLIPADTSGPYGPGALGISAFSNVLTGWTQGGPVAIHGTNEPWSIGHAVSNGCIRVRNPVLRRLFDAVSAGTPVLVRP